MKLADYILAARGTPVDIGGFATRMARYIQEAQRFEISDDVGRAAGGLVDSRPSALVAALPLCRLPYDTMWVEWRGGLGTHNYRGEAAAPTPARQGMLIETPPTPGMQGRVGYMTLAWVHTHHPDMPNAVNFSPISIYFDWRHDGDVRNIIDLSHRTILEKYRGARYFDLLKLYVGALQKNWCQISSPEAVAHFFTGHNPWKKFATNAKEIEAIRYLDHHALPGLSPHGIEFVGTIISLATADELRHLMANWQADIQGEATFIERFLAMLNSRNPVVEHEPVDLFKLNRARRRGGKPEFLPYTKTRLAMSRWQARMADAAGISRDAARQHLVRGHFKIRTNKRTKESGVFWWSPFLRGDPRRGEVQRDEYEIVK